MSTARLTEGTLLNERYRIEAILGRGGMGTVYRALDTRLDVSVAVKETIEQDPDSPEGGAASAQFEREARLLAQLSHPNLPRVSDYFVENGRWYLVMELIQGETLEQRLQESAGQPLPLSDVLDWGIQLADVLAYLHRQEPPILFRDLKPGNVMVQADGLVRLIDFGIARRFQQGSSRDTLLYGSPGYSPPEQYGRSQTSPRSDVYALGATLHHLLSGRDPSSSPFKFPPLRSLNPEVPPALDRLVAQAVEMDEAQRCRSAIEVREALTSIRSDEEARGAQDREGHLHKPVSPTEAPPRVVSARLRAAEGNRALRRTTRRAILVAGPALVILAMAAAGLKLVSRRQHEAQARATHQPAAPASKLQAPDPASSRPPSLQIATSPPGVTAWLDGQELGPTPIQLPSVPVGTHNLRLVPRPGSGFAEASRQIMLEAGQSVAVDIALAVAPPSSPTAAPSAAFLSGPTATVVDTPGAGRPQGARSAVAALFDLRVVAGVGHSVTAEVRFADQSGQLLKPRAPGSAYQNEQGILSTSRELAPQADPTDFPGIALYVPTGAFPATVMGTTVNCQAVVYIDGKPVVQSSPVGVQLPVER